ncbi:MAG: hypothetical protein Q4E28_01155 [Clostridia bacterium]|nr:hypothetical protein [Clostridia bacterium]
MKALKIYLKQNSGAAAVVEMTMILPIVISVLFFLITISLTVGYYLSCYSNAGKMMTKQIEQIENGEKGNIDTPNFDYDLQRDREFLSEKITVTVNRGAMKDRVYGKAIKGARVVDQMNFVKEIFDKYLSENKTNKLKEKILNTKNKVVSGAYEK